MIQQSSSNVSCSIKSNPVERIFLVFVVLLTALTACAKHPHVPGDELPCEDGLVLPCHDDDDDVGPVCGNHAVESGEQCDDGNTTAADGCSAACQGEVCGNGVLDPGEQCDDGNNVENDACLGTCTDATINPNSGNPFPSVVGLESAADDARIKYEMWESSSVSELTATLPAGQPPLDAPWERFVSFDTPPPYGGNGFANGELVVVGGQGAVSRPLSYERGLGVYGGASDSHIDQSETVWITLDAPLVSITMGFGSADASAYRSIALSRVCLQPPPGLGEAECHDVALIDQATYALSTNALIEKVAILPGPVSAKLRWVRYTPCAKIPGYPATLSPPLGVGQECLEINSTQGLGNLFRPNELDHFYRRAQLRNSSRVEVPHVLKLGVIYLKNARFQSTGILGGDGQPLSAVVDISDEEQQREQGLLEDRFSRLLLGASRGAIGAEWVVREIREVTWSIPGSEISGAPYQGNASEITGKVANEYETDEIDVWTVRIRNIATSNPVVDSTGKVTTKMTATAAGLAFQGARVNGANFTMTAAWADDLGYYVHELEHIIIDWYPKTRLGFGVQDIHGNGLLGYTDRDLSWRRVASREDAMFTSLNVGYRDRLRFMLSRDMWSEYNEMPIRPRSPIPTGTGRPWSTVRDDFWHMLPALTGTEVASLLGVSSVSIQQATTSWSTAIRVGATEANSVTSRYVDLTLETEPPQPNNIIDRERESSAVLCTNTGCWFFVRPCMVDVYTTSVARRLGVDLAAYGFVRQHETAASSPGSMVSYSTVPLIVLRAPSNTRIPNTELDYLK